VYNRAVAGVRLFDGEGDYYAFEQAILRARDQTPMRICAYCLMPNHWHFVLWPERDGQLPKFMQRLTLSHVRSWQEHRQLVGMGHLYQGRYRSPIIQDDGHFLQLVRYVERNALRANLVARAEDWPWSSLWRWHRGEETEEVLLHPWPLPRPPEWLNIVNEPQTDKQVVAIRRSLRRGHPYGAPVWRERMANLLGIQLERRRPGRPKKR
jgi:putative transposase